MRPLQAALRLVPVGPPFSVQPKPTGEDGVPRGPLDCGGRGVNVDSVKVPQHLELEDVVAWGLGVIDLLSLVAGAAAAWWLYLAVPGELALRLVAAAPAALIGLSFGVMRIGELSL